ncbi:hypothetical protein ACFQ3Z_46160 [Streptomyces nogalater]
MTSLDRRSFIAYTSGALAALAHQWAVTEPGRLPWPAVRGHVDTELVTWLEAAGTELVRLATERRQHTHRLLSECLTTVTALISEGRYTRPIEQRLHTLAASLSQAIAWQHFDERRHAAAGRFWHAALHNAHTAGQRDLGAGILSDLAYQLLWLTDARGAVAILEHAIPRTQHPTARSLLHLRQARALAALGEDGPCRLALTAAEKALQTPPAPRRPPGAPGWGWRIWLRTAAGASPISASDGRLTSSWTRGSPCSRPPAPKHARCSSPTRPRPTSATAKSRSPPRPPPVPWTWPTGSTRPGASRWSAAWSQRCLPTRTPRASTNSSNGCGPPTDQAKMARSA